MKTRTRRLLMPGFARLCFAAAVFLTSAAHADIFVNVNDFMADPTGANDSSAACQSAVNSIPAGGTVFFPRGTYRFTGGCIVKNNVHIVGEGQGATTIRADLSTPYVFQIGAGSPTTPCSRCSIERLTITRASGSWAPTTIGISAESVDYDSIVDVDISMQGFGVRTGTTNPQMSLGLVMDRVRIFNCRYGAYLNNIAEVMISDSNFGKNGIESVAPIAMLTIAGPTNDVRVKTTQFIPRINPNTTAAIAFTGITSGNPGYYRFVDINTENVQTVFTSDASSAAVWELYLTNSRLTTNGPLSTLNAATAMINWNINNSSIGFGQATTLTGGKYARFLGNFVNGALTFNGGNWIVGDNTFTTDSAYSGAFSSLVLSGNQAVFNASVAVHFNVTGTGKITISGNGVDVGSPPTDRPQ